MVLFPVGLDSKNHSQPGAGERVCGLDYPSIDIKTTSVFSDAQQNTAV